MITFGKTIIRPDENRVPKSYEPLVVQATIVHPSVRKSVRPSATGPRATLRKLVFTAQDQLFTDEEGQASESSSSQAAAKYAEEHASIISDDDDDDEIPAVPSARPSMARGLYNQRPNQPLTAPPATQVPIKPETTPQPTPARDTSPIIVISGSERSSIRAASPVQPSSPPALAAITGLPGFVTASSLPETEKQQDSHTATQEILPSTQADEVPMSEMDTAESSGHKHLVTESSDDEDGHDSDEHDENERDGDEEHEDDEDEAENEGVFYKASSSLIDISEVREIEVEDEEMDDEGDEDEDEEDNDDGIDEISDEESEEEEDDDERLDEDEAIEIFAKIIGLDSSDEEEEDSGDEDEMSEGASQIFDTSPHKPAPPIPGRSNSVSSNIDDAEPVQKNVRRDSPIVQDSGDTHNEGNSKDAEPARNTDVDIIECPHSGSLQQGLGGFMAAPFFLAADGRPINSPVPKKVKTPKRDASTQVDIKRQISYAVQTVAEDSPGRKSIEAGTSTNEESAVASKKRKRQVIVETGIVRVGETVEVVETTEEVETTVTEDVNTTEEIQLPATPSLVEFRPKKGLPWRAAAKYTSAMALGAVAAVIGLAAIPDLD